MLRPKRRPVALDAATSGVSAGGAGAEQALERARDRGWTVVSLGHDRRRVLAPTG